MAFYRHDLREFLQFWNTVVDIINKEQFAATAGVRTAYTAW